MKMKKFLRGPWLWIGLALGVMLIGSQLMTTQQFTKVDTQVGLELIESGKAKTVKIFDGAQRVDVTLSKPDPEYGEQIQFFYVAGREVAVTKAVAEAPVAEGWTDEVQRTPWYLALLGSLLPFIIIFSS
jgi:cell division protease FtsH